MDNIFIDPEFSAFFPSDTCGSFSELVEVLFGLELESVEDRSVVIRKDLQAPHGPRIDVYLKLYSYRRKSFWQRLLREGRVKREARNLRFFEGCGIPVPRPVAWGQKLRAGIKIEYEFLITLAIPYVMPLCQFAQRPVDPLQRRRLLCQLAENVRVMHRRHFFHRDLKWRNLLVSESPNGVPMIYWIDCPSGYVDRIGLRRRRGRVKDLATLDKVARSLCSLKERLLFLKYYLARVPGQRNIRNFAQSVDRYHRCRHQDD